MGTLTRGSIVSQGLLKAGRTDITAYANTELNAWLRKVYKSWPWPFLKRRTNGKNGAPSPITLSGGAQTLLVGNGNSGISVEVARIFKTAYLYTTDYSRRTEVQIRPDAAWAVTDDPDINDPTKTVGMPTGFVLRPNPATQGTSAVEGIWQLTPWPVPDVTYQLVIDFLEQPADLATDATIPYYPGDETMIKAVEVAGLKYNKMLEEYQFEMNVLNSMTVNDRLRWGDQPGMNDNMGLDPGVFT